MRGCDPFESLYWLEDDLILELQEIQKQNSNLLADLPANLNWEQRINIWKKLPPTYQNLDVEEHILGLARDKNDLERISWELSQFNDKNLIPLLKCIKYLVDLMKSNKLVSGVGRGSSVSSLVLFLLGVHKIDPIKWNLDPHEFFR